MQEIFPGVFAKEKMLFTKNFAPGKRVYGERLLSESGVEYRQWDTFRSKLAAAIKNGLDTLPIKAGSKVLYLGAAEGTTLSHISDIIGEKGAAFGVDVSERVMRKFISICEERKNIVPILEDAAKPWAYGKYLEGTRINVLYQDVSQRDQAEIFLKNAEYFLPKGGWGLLAIKARSISQRKKAQDIFEEETAKLARLFIIRQVINLAPFEKDHTMVLCEKSG
ncbi:MAG: fibrillarin-like rRNA/tRNA 2'-O-methyltransferase [Candidatus Diapherotrites archaeon]|nr:fibrillarin-like rRNA/tRNA 2'-O-methyltransferase [Candidatus Diapherotrites archaeon]